MKNSSPAFLFYSSDFLNGVADLTMEERGQYITMMCLQHQKGALSEKTIRLCLGSVSVDVLSKFKQDENGLYYNERLKDEIDKREQFVDSRKFNGKKGGRPKNHMVNHMVNGRLDLAKAKNNLTENDNEYIEDNIENKKEGLREEEKEKKKKPTFSEDVEYIYSLYPSKCPKRNMGTGKSSNDKEKIKRLLTTMSKEELEFTIKAYVEESLRNDSFLKNFSTLLNNLPDMGYLKEQPIIKAQTSKYR